MAAREALARVGLSVSLEGAGARGVKPRRVRLAGRPVRLRRRSARRGAGPGFGEAVGVYLEALRAANRSAETRRQYGTALGHFVSWAGAARPAATCADLDHGLADAFVGHLRRRRPLRPGGAAGRPHGVPVRHRPQALRPLGRPRAGATGRPAPWRTTTPPRLRRGGHRPLHPGGAGGPARGRRPPDRLHGPAPAGDAPGGPGHRDAPRGAAPADGADAGRGHRAASGCRGRSPRPAGRARCTCSGRPWRPSAPGSPGGRPPGCRPPTGAPSSATWRGAA